MEGTACAKPREALHVVPRGPQRLGSDSSLTFSWDVLHTPSEPEGNLNHPKRSLMILHLFGFPRSVDQLLQSLCEGIIYKRFSEFKNRDILKAE